MDALRRTIIIVVGTVFYVLYFYYSGIKDFDRRDSIEAGIISARYHLEKGDAFSDENQPELALLEYERALDFKPDWDVALAKIKVEKSPGRSKWRELDLKTELAREMSDDGDSEAALALYLDIQDEFPKYYLPWMFFPGGDAFDYRRVRSTVKEKRWTGVSTSRNSSISTTPKISCARSTSSSASFSDSPSSPSG